MPNIPKITTFENPWPLEGEYDKLIHGRVSADMPLEIKSAITSLRPTLGTPQIVINILWTKLITALNEHNITTFTQQSEFCDFVANCRIADGRLTPNPSGGTAPGVVPQAATPDVSGREASMAGTNPQPPDKSCDAPRTNGGGSKAVGQGGKTKSRGKANGSA